MIQRLIQLSLRTKLLIAIAIIALGCAALWLIPTFAPCTATFTKEQHLLTSPFSDEIRATVPNGYRAPVVARTGDKWIEVGVNGQRGWVYGDEYNFVKLSGACWNVPWIEFGE